MKTILVFGASAAMATMIRRTLAPCGFDVRLISDLLKMPNATGICLIIAAGEPRGCPESVSLLLETLLEVPILVVLNGNTSRRMLSLVPHAAATLQWPFFPSDLLAAITLCKAGEEGLP